VGWKTKKAARKLICSGAALVFLMMLFSCGLELCTGDDLLLTDNTSPRFMRLVRIVNYGGQQPISTLSTNSILG